MRIAVITGGPIYPEASFIARDADAVYCADSGLDFCLANGIKPDIYYGDMDSVSAEGLDFLEHSDIPKKVFSTHKDMTDTELALCDCPPGSTVDLICSLTGRIDHVLANLGLLVKFKESGYDIAATDGMTDVIPVIGEDKVTIEGCWEEGSVAVSLIPYANDKVTGVTTENLAYPLSGADLYPTSSFSVSNEPVKDCDHISVSVGSGRLLLTIAKSL